MASEGEVPNYWLGPCVGCSTTNPHGLHLRFWHSEQGCFTKCVIPDYLCGTDEVVHRGILTLLADEVAQWTNIGRLGQLGMTRSISVQYLKPVRTNTEIAVESRIVSQDERSAVQRSTIHTADDTLAAESRSEGILPGPAAIARVARVDEATLRQFPANYHREGGAAEQ